MEYSKFLFSIEILLIILNIISLILVLLLYVQSRDTAYKVTFLKGISENWNLGAPTQVTKGVNGFQCPSQNPFVNDKWPGTVDGCGPTTIKRVRCGKYGTTIPAIPEMPYYIWRNTTLCSERIPATYLDLTIADSKQNCPSNMRSCGIIDTMNNVMCVPFSTPCPYNYMQILPKDQSIKLSFNYTLIPMNQANLVLSNENTSGKIIIDLLVNDGPPCADSSYKNYLVQPYILEKYYDRSTCDHALGSLVYDKDYELKDDYSYFSIYSENNIFVRLSNVPNFNNYFEALKFSSRTMKLYAKNYIGIKSQCNAMIKEQNLSVNLMLDLSNIHSNLNGSDETILYAVIFGAIGVAVYLLYEGIVMCVLCAEPCEEKEYTMRNLIMIVPQLFCFVMLVIACIMVAKFTGLANTYEFLIDNNCVDQNLFDAMVEVRNSIRSICSLSIICLIICSLNLIVFISSVVFYFCPKNEKKVFVKADTIAMSEKTEQAEPKTL
jgi:hypothetical protein